MPPTVAQSPTYRGRFAPSPTGPLHLGSLTAALGSWLMARQHGGAWLLRIEDLDPLRELPTMAQQHIRALGIFGMASDAPVIWQSERCGFYAEALQTLLAAGVAFECRCSRNDLSASNGVHRRCVDQPSGLQSAWRIRMPCRIVGFNDSVRGHFQQNLGEDVGDVVMKRADGLWSYQLAVVVDDALQAITQVVRGADLIDSTPRQIFLQQSLAYRTPSYAHLPLLTGPGGIKLSKSSGSAALDLGNPLPSLRLAYGWLGQEMRELDGCTSVQQALNRALAAFQPNRIPATDHLLLLA